MIFCLRQFYFNLKKVQRAYSNKNFYVLGNRKLILYLTRKILKKNINNFLTAKF
jgi:hypothetical protein